MADKGKVVDGGDDGARRKRRGGELHVQKIDGPAAQLRRERHGDAHERRVRERAAHGEVGPAARVALDRRALRHVERVQVLAVDLRQRLDEVRGVGLVPGQPGADRVRVYRDVQQTSSRSRARRENGNCRGVK